MNLKNFRQLNWLKICAALFDFSILAIVFGTPLYLSLLFKTNNLFDLSKLFWFSIFLSLAAIFFLLKVLILAKRREKIFFPGFFSQLKTYLPSLILLLFLALSLLWSQNYLQSFFGSYQRSDGIINYFLYFVFAVLVSFYLVSAGNEKVIQKLKVILLAGTFSASVVSLYAVCQYFGWDFLSWQEPAIQTHRSSSTLFQPNFLASFLLLTIPLAFLLAFLSKRTLTRYFFGSLGLLQIFALITTGSRGAWLSWSLSLFLFLIIFLVQKKTYLKKIKFFGFSLLFLFLVGVGFSTNERFKEVFNFSQGSSAYRVEIYQAAISQIKNRIWLGYGAESQQERLVRAYRSDFAVFDSVNLLPDRIHNLFLDLTLCFGLVGLSIWLLWYFSIFHSLWLIFKKNNNQALALAFGFAIFSYLFSLLFSFSVATTAVYLFLLLGIVSVFTKEPKELILSFNFQKYFSILVFLVISIFFLVYSFRVMVADSYFYYFNQSWERQEYLSAFKHRENILALGVFEVDYRKMMLVKMLDLRINHYDNQIKEKIVAISREDENLFNPNSVFDLQSLMELKFFSGDFAQAKIFSRLLLEATPLWPRAFYSSGVIFSQMGETSEARALFGQANSLFPDQQDRRLSQKHEQAISLVKSDLFFEIAWTYEMEKEWRKASNYYGLAYLGNNNNLVALERIAICFDQLGENDRAKSIRAMIKNVSNQ